VGGAGEAHDLFSATLHLIKAPKDPSKTESADSDIEQAASRIEGENPQ
jgi:hypothetical protein